MPDRAGLPYNAAMKQRHSRKIANRRVAFGLSQARIRKAVAYAAWLRSTVPTACDSIPPMEFIAPSWGAIVLPRGPHIPGGLR